MHYEGLLTRLPDGFPSELASLLWITAGKGMQYAIPSGMDRRLALTRRTISTPWPDPFSEHPTPVHVTFDFQLVGLAVLVNRWGRDDREEDHACHACNRRSSVGTSRGSRPREVGWHRHLAGRVASEGIVA